MATHPSIDHDTLLMLAQGLAKAILQQEKARQQEVGQLQDTIKSLKQNIQDNTDRFVNLPKGYEYNDSILDFDIPVGSRIYQPAKWVKCLDSERATVYSTLTLQDPTMTPILSTCMLNPLSTSPWPTSLSPSPMVPPSHVCP
jgi:hypothetical protein